MVCDSEAHKKYEHRHDTCDKYIVQEHDLVETDEGFACFTCGYVGGW